MYIDVAILYPLCTCVRTNDSTASMCVHIDKRMQKISRLSNHTFPDIMITTPFRGEILLLGAALMITPFWWRTFRRGTGSVK